MRATPPSLRMSDGHALKRHHRAGARVLRNFGLLGVGDIHDHAAFQHLGQPDFHPPRFIPVEFHLSSPCLWFRFV